MTQGLMTDGDKEQNVSFSKDTGGFYSSVPSSVDPTRELQDMSDVQLSNFFARPIKTRTYTWDINTNFFEQFNPWKDYFENPRVLNRLTNYYLMRANLKVKFVINGNPFFYGRLLASYLPLDTYDALSASRSSVLQDAVAESQRPHVFLNPTQSMGGELCLPFFYHKNNINIFAEEWNDMGRIYMRTLNQLYHANGATDAITVSVFVWAEDVKLSMLTSYDPPSLTPQSGEIDMASKEGVISKPASTIAKIASALTAVPVLKPYAVATNMMATMVSNVASRFGYSRPTDVSAPKPYKPMMLSSFSATDAVDDSVKLTVDSKQELSIDPRISGIESSTDPLVITSISTRESYLTSFNWDFSIAPESLLWNCRVDPMLWAESGGPDPAPIQLHFPAMAVAAMPFTYWTGTIKFRFQVVCSGFHKGRLRVKYDPIAVANDEYNVTYQKIIDISEVTDFTMDIGVAQETSLIPRINQSGTNLVDVYGTVPLIDTDFSEGNGVLSVTMLNDLTSPNSTVVDPVQINVYVSTGEDFEVFVPNRDFQQYVLSPQSGELSPTPIDTAEAPPVSEESDTLAISNVNHGLLNLVYTGEQVTSFRQLLKRFNLHTQNLIGGTTTANGRTVYTVFNMFPFLRGNVSGAVHQAAGPVPYNYCNTVMLHWATLPFQGWRGSIRWKVLYGAGDGVSFQRPAHIEITRSNESLGYVYSSTTTPAFSSNFEAASKSVVSPLPFSSYSDPDIPLSGAEGMAITRGSVNPTLEIESPFYSPDRFDPGKVENHTTSFDRGLVMRAETYPNQEGTIRYYCAAGEDFTVYFWTGMPPLYLESAPPAP